jgi:hypothetical protein
MTHRTRTPAPAAISVTSGRPTHPGRSSPASPPSFARLTGLARLGTWVALLVGAHLALGRAAAILPVPAPGTDVLEWLHHADPVVAAFSVLRLGALAITWYLTVVTALLLLARLSRITALLHVADRVTVPVVRRFLHRAVGTGLAVAIAGGTVPLLTSGGAVAFAEPPPPVVTMHLIDETAPAPTTAPLPPAAPRPPDSAPPSDRRPAPGAAPVPEVRMIEIDEVPAADAATSASVPADQGGGTDRADDGVPPPEPPATDPARRDPPPTTPAATTPAATTPPTMQVTPDDPAPVRPSPSPTAEGHTREGPSAGARDVPPAVEAAPPAGDTPDPDVWTVQPGDHFWHIAEVTVHRARGATVTDETIAAYWRALIAANSERLVVPGVADLIIPGQQFVLPPVPPAAAA